MTQQQNEDFEARAQQLTTQAERSQSVSDELNAMPFQDRLTMARRMDEINAERRTTNSSLPDLELVTKKDAGGQEHLMDMTARKEDNFLYFDSTTDIYNMPSGVEKKWTDYIANTQTTRDLADSRRRFGVGINSLEY
jgi:hypothetical protein